MLRAYYLNLLRVSKAYIAQVYAAILKVRSALMFIEDVVSVVVIAYVCIILNLVIIFFRSTDPLSYYLLVFIRNLFFTSPATDLGLEQSLEVFCLMDALYYKDYTEGASKTYRLLMSTWELWSNIDPSQSYNIPWSVIKDCLTGVVCCMHFFSWVDWYHFWFNTAQPLTPLSLLYEVNKGFVYGLDGVSYPEYIRRGFKCLWVADMSWADSATKITALEFLAFMSAACDQPICRIIF